MINSIFKKSSVREWEKFHKDFRLKKDSLLSHVHHFPQAVFVSGCQRSGTTLVSRMVRSTKGFTDLTPEGMDDELFSAHILCGATEVPFENRYCFQTTYINEFYEDYLKLKEGQKLIWVLRNPFSVIYSMLYHWKKFPLDELFIGCGLEEAPLKDRFKIAFKGLRYYPSVLKACYAYNAKIQQLSFLFEHIPEKVLVLEYDSIIQEPKKFMEELSTFIRASYSDDLLKTISSKNVDKKKKLKQSEFDIISQICVPNYEWIKKKVL